MHRQKIRRYRSCLLPHPPPPGLARRACAVIYEAWRDGRRVEGEDDGCKGISDVGARIGARQVGEEGEVRFDRV